MMTNYATQCSNHKPVQHRDAKPPWCNNCGLTANYLKPASRFDTNHAELEITDPQDIAKRLILNVYNEAVGEGSTLTLDDILIVWYAYTLGNWKCLITTTVQDDRYYEVTRNKEKREAYVDSYVKISNRKFVNI
jgi:hypothetical protein